MRQHRNLIFSFVFGVLHSLNAQSAEQNPARQPLTIQAISPIQCWVLKAEQLQSPSERSRGFSEPPPNIASLLFEWPTPTARNFWMHETRIPLLLFRLDRSGNRETVGELKPNDLTVNHDPGRGFYAIEIRLDHLSSETIQGLKKVTRFRGGPFEPIADVDCVDINYRVEPISPSL